MDLGMRDKSVMVTGGSGGIGRGLVLRFAKEGCNVVIATRDHVQGQQVADAARGLDGQAVLIPRCDQLGRRVSDGERDHTPVRQGRRPGRYCRWHELIPAVHRDATRRVADQPQRLERSELHTGGR
jgi:NAD(P)-dependent dehydrogenase (short-subunit alcohol dehydrogenase family)